MKKNTNSLTDDFICDNPAHKEERPAYSQVSIHSWHGSKNPFKQGTLHLCDECAENVVFLLSKEFQQKKFLKSIEEF